MANKFWPINGDLTGGGADDLDGIDGSLITNGDIALCVVDGEAYLYEANTSGGLSENSPKVIVPDSNPGSINWELQNTNRMHQNLLTNSGFDVWSNSTLENVGSAIKDDDMADDDTADWAQDGDSLSFDTDHYEFATSGADKYMIYNNNVSVTSGKLYKISIDIKDGTASGETLKLYMYDNTTSHRSPIKTTTGSWVTHTFVFEATATTSTGDAGLDGVSDCGGNNIELKNFTFYEVTPGCVAANFLAPDSWYKLRQDTDIWREHWNGTGGDSDTVKAGSLYAIKIAGGATDGYVTWPSLALENNVEHVKRFLGRTVTLGAWVKCSSASKARVRILTGVGATASYSAYHSGGGGWEWLEVTQTVATSSTYALFSIDSGISTTAYYSQPMLVFGASIGEGNYSRPPGEIVWFEQNVESNKFDSTTGWSDDGWSDLNVEADSNGAVPKGAKALMVQTKVNDSGSAAGAEANLQLTSDNANQNRNLANDVRGITNDATHMLSGQVPCNADGDIEYLISASGAGTLDIAHFNYIGVQLR